MWRSPLVGGGKNPAIPQSTGSGKEKRLSTTRAGTKFHLRTNDIPLPSWQARDSLRMKWKVVCVQVEYRFCAGHAERFSLPDVVDCGILYWILPPTTKGERHVSEQHHKCFYCKNWTINRGLPIDCYSWQPLGGLLRLFFTDFSPWEWEGVRSKCSRQCATQKEV